MIHGYFEDNTVGRRSVTRGRTVTEADVVGFAGLSGDWHPLHTDVDYATRGPFGERIAHGMLVLSIATGLAPLDPQTILAFYGIDRLRFVRPTMLGDTIHAETEIVEATPKDDSSGIIASEVRILNGANELIVIAVFRMLVRRRGQDTVAADGAAARGVGAH
jgi:3-hydroxybutyryl-CoA dehydratase